MYAQLPVFKYQTFDQGSLFFSKLPVSPPPTSTVRYFGAVTDLAPKSEEVAKQTPPETDAAETLAEPTPESPSEAEGQHE